MRTAEMAEGKWHGIIPRYGCDESFLKNRHGPCPMCGGKDRFRFDNKQGRGTWICNQCGSGDGFDLIQRITGMTFSEIAKEIDGISGKIEAVRVRTVDYDANRKRLRATAGKLKKVQNGDPVDLYLKSRGIKFAPDCIKIHPGMNYYEEGKMVGQFPAMVSLVSDGEAVTYHVVYLTNDGKKADVSACKKILPPVKPLDGACVRIGGDSDAISIAEGVETALAIHSYSGKPCWSALSSGNLEKFIVPAGCNHVTIYADNDESYTGQKSAYTLAAKIKKSGVDCEVLIPPITGEDYCDVIARYRQNEK